MNTVPGAQSVNEDTALSIAGVSVNDVDGNPPPPAHGEQRHAQRHRRRRDDRRQRHRDLTLSGTPARSTRRWRASPTGQPQLQWRRHADGRYLGRHRCTDTDTVAITVNPVNDAPVNTVPGAQSVNEDTALPIGGVTVDDVDGDRATTR